MNKYWFDKLYVNNLGLIRCDTLYKAQQFFHLANSFGYGYIGNEDNYGWHKYKTNTVYTIGRSRSRCGTIGWVELCKDPQFNSPKTVNFPAQFTKSMLEDGMELMDHYGDVFFVLNATNSIHNKHGDRVAYLNSFNEDLSFAGEDTVKDIILVRDNKGVAVWERFEKIQDRIEWLESEVKLLNRKIYKLEMENKLC